MKSLFFLITTMLVMSGCCWKQKTVTGTWYVSEDSAAQELKSGYKLKVSEFDGFRTLSISHRDFGTTTCKDERAPKRYPLEFKCKYNRGKIDLDFEMFHSYSKACDDAKPQPSDKEVFVCWSMSSTYSELPGNESGTAGTDGL